MLAEKEEAAGQEYNTTMYVSVDHELINVTLGQNEFSKLATSNNIVCITREREREVAISDGSGTYPKSDFRVHGKSTEK